MKVKTRSRQWDGNATGKGMHIGSWSGLSLLMLAQVGDSNLQAFADCFSSSRNILDLPSRQIQSLDE